MNWYLKQRNKISIISGGDKILNFEMSLAIGKYLIEPIRRSPSWYEAKKFSSDRGRRYWDEIFQFNVHYICELSQKNVAKMLRSFKDIISRRKCRKGILFVSLRVTRQFEQVSYEVMYVFRKKIKVADISKKKRKWAKCPTDIIDGKGCLLTTLAFWQNTSYTYSHPINKVQCCTIR